MARLFPSDLTPEAIADANMGELRTLKLLGRKLSDNYSIFHSVHWSLEGRERTSFGEIDFVIVNRSGEILVIEQKDGPLEESDGELVKVYGDGRKSVNSQIQRNIGRLRKKFKKSHGSEQGLLIDYLIYCPQHRVVNVNAAGVDMSRTVDAREKSSLPERVTALLGSGAEAESTRGDLVKRFLAHSFQIAPDVSTYITGQDRVYTQLVEGLADTVDKLEFSPFRLRVVGTAGCGKSQLTLRFADRCLAEGKRTLLLCFNRPLADRLRQSATGNLTVDTYYGFCARFVSTLGISIDFDRIREPGFWREIQEQAMGASIPQDAQFDAVIIDEGQDFKQEWFEILRLFLRDDASILWLEDPLQNLRNTDEVELQGFVVYRDSGNFRTPRTIAQFIKDTLELDFTQKNGLPGLGVDVHEYTKKEDQRKIVTHRVSELMRVGFSVDEIALVSCRGMASSAFGTTDRIGSLSIRRFTGDYDKEGEQVYTDGTLLFDTIYRFKGQQAPAVILLDIDESLDQSELARRILYCGMTRATVRLEMLVSAASPWLSPFREAL